MDNDKIKQEIINRLNERVKDQTLLQKFVHSFYSYIPLDYNDNYDIGSFIDIAVQNFDYFQNRTLGKHQIYITNEIISEGNINEGYTIVRIINDDMPFLVDSITELLIKKKYQIRQFINALLVVTRDKTGGVIDINNEKHVKPNESFIYIKLDLIKDNVLITRLEAELSHVLNQVKKAVTDWPKMVAVVDDTLTWIVDQEGENYAFLKWLRNDNFTFTGYREYYFSARNKKTVVKYDNKTDLGILSIEDQELNNDIIEDVFAAHNYFDMREDIITIGKIKTISQVHRYSNLDYICVLKKHDNDKIIARVFLGLFASKLDYQSVTTIPMIRDKVLGVVKKAGFDKVSFLGKELFSIVETLPREELFQFTEEELFHTSMKVLSCLNNPRLLVFARTTQCKNFLNLLVFFPKLRVTSDVVDKVRGVVKEFIPGKFINSTLKMSSMALAYVYIVLKVRDNNKLHIDILKIEHELDHATSLWNEKLGFFIEKKFGKNNLSTLLSVYNKAFPSNYHSRFTVEDAVEDIVYIEKFSSNDDIFFNLYQKPNAKKNHFNLKIYTLGNKIELFKIMPIIENLGFQSLAEDIFVLEVAKCGLTVFIQEFSLSVANKKTFSLDEIKSNIEEAIEVIYHGKLQNYVMNGLILSAGLHWRQVFLLSAYCKYMLQIKFPYSQDYICSVLIKHSALPKHIVELFYKMFDANEKNNADISKLRHKIQHELDKILDSVEDRVIRKVLDLVDNTLRTNYFQTSANNHHKDYISLKFNSAAILDLPQPKPFVEIFIYSSRMEGIHLRGGKVARGGIRWSDRSEDYRTEVLGLMKAQMTKNSIIVPVGSKGGFLVKNTMQLATKEEYMAEGVECYKTFLRGLLDITDNIVNRKVVHPKQVVCLDGDDPYLVVAADKGTATFSDIANQVSREYNFWLGDAFASGGSAGYDHKKIGITARGAWVSVEEHFRSLGINPNKDTITTVGIGDMSGDVFGNGMLLSRHIKLVAAFNHIHIFIDPDPDEAISFEERRRLFSLPHSNWSDYNSKLISEGGGVFERGAKSINLSPQIKSLLGIEQDTIDPDSLIRYILTAKVDLLWNGGIGTYVKAESETNEQIGNKGNDSVRVNGKDLRCKVVAEGGNLGFTQLARIEYEFHGGKINTDAIDNSAGVDCSDHEVNIKIALSPAVESGKLQLETRDKLLADMTNEVAELVLYDNKIQNQSLSISSAHSVKMFESYVRFMHKLEQDKLLDRKIEFLPSDEAITTRLNTQRGFTRPEIAVLMAYSKNVIDKNLFKSKLSDDPYCNKYLISYFPSKMQKEYLNEILNHQLKREIISTVIANKIVNYLGSYFFHVAQEYTGLSGCDIARAFCVVWEIFDLERLWYEVDHSESKIKTELLGMIQSFVQTAIYWFLRNKSQVLNIEKAISEFAVETRSLIKNIDKFLTGELKTRFFEKYKYCCDNNLPPALGQQLAGLNMLYSAMDIIVVATSHSISASKVSLIYFAVGDRFHLDWLKNAADQLPANTYWKRMLIKTIKDDIYDNQRRLAAKIITSADSISNKSIDEWVKANAKKVEIFDNFINSIKSIIEIDSDKLVVATKQIDILTNK
jgi:glutamate dehydrogenase